MPHGEQIEGLLSASRELVGERGVRGPSLQRFWLSAFNRLFVLGAILMLLYSWYWGLGILMLFAAALVLYPIAVFYDVRMKACQVHLVYATLTGGAASMREAKAATSQVRRSLRTIAVVDLFLTLTRLGSAWADSRNPRILGQRNTLARALRTVMPSVETLFGALEDCVLPAVVIERKALSELAEWLGRLEKDVPAPLAGAFGLDRFAGAVSSLRWLLYLGLLALGATLSLVLVSKVPPFLLITVRAPSPVAVFPLPVFVSLLLLLLLSRGLRIFVSSLKTIYFTVRYTSIRRAQEIRPELRQPITDYLTRKAQTPATS